MNTSDFIANLANTVCVSSYLFLFTIFYNYLAQLPRYHFVAAAPRSVIDLIALPSNIVNNFFLQKSYFLLAFY